MSVTKKLLLVICAMLSPTLLADSHPNSLPKVPCGVERWPVKTLTDLDRGEVSFAPVQTTVAQLAALPRRRVPYSRDRRVAPEELTTYRLRARLITSLGHERDSDIHLFLIDPDQ